MSIPLLIISGVPAFLLIAITTAAVWFSGGREDLRGAWRYMLIFLAGLFFAAWAIIYMALRCQWFHIGCLVCFGC